MKLQSLKMFKTTKDMFYKQLDFLRIDRADYGASWSLSFDIKRQKHDILYILESFTAVSAVLKKYDPLL